jgi:hypothetical protein
MMLEKPPIEGGGSPSLEVIYEVGTITDIVSILAG